MTESERNEKFQREWELRKKISDEKAKKNQEIFNFVKIGLDAYINFGKEINRISKQFLTQYYDSIQKKIVELADLTEICRFLLSEKRKCLAIAVEYDIRKEGLLGADFKTAIEKIIEPFYKQFETELEFEKKHPQIEQSNPSNNTDLQKQNNTKIESSKISIPEKSNPIIIKDALELPYDFNQISCEASADEILNYFMILAKEKNKFNGNSYMEEEDIKAFVKNNFFIFKTPPIRKYFPINLLPEQKGRLRYFVFQFYLKYDRKQANTKINYANLLINNFEVFKNDKPENLITNMSESKKPKSSQNIIPIDRYLAK